MSKPGRPDYIKCVRKQTTGAAWCGYHVGNVWAFEDSEHAALNGDQEGRMIVCRECRDAIVKALDHGFESEE